MPLEKRYTEEVPQCQIYLSDRVLCKNQKFRIQLMQSFYVHNLKSMKTNNEANTVVWGTLDQLRCDGYRLTKFVANDEEILSQV